LLKVIEEPGARTVWLLCAPTLTDVIPTIRSRCRHLTLRTPSIKALTQLLIERDGIEPKMAEFAANAAQGHVGRAKYLATNEQARKTREKILCIPFTVKDLASAFEAANTLVDLAKSQALAESEVRDEAELAKLKEFYGTTGSKLATGGSKVVKELEKEQKTRSTRKVKDYLDQSFLEYKNQFTAELIGKENSTDESAKIIKKIHAVDESRRKLANNSSIQLTTESLFCQIR
jgi:DNA polymerase-3 subunit delta'